MAVVTLSDLTRNNNKTIQKALKKTWKILITPRGKQQLQEQIMLFTTLHQLLEGGIKLPEALLMCTEILPRKQWQETLHFLSNQLKKGVSFDQALQNAPFPFSSLVSTYAEAGSKSGNYAPIFHILATQLSETAKSHQLFTTQLTYPITTLVTSITLFVLLVFVWFPSILPTLQELNTSPPPFTFSLLSFLQHNTSVLTFTLFGVGLFFVFWRLYRARQKFQHNWFHGVVLTIPFIGQIIILRSIVVFVQAFSHLLKARTSYLTTLKMCITLIPNSYIQQRLLMAFNTDIIENGNTLSQSLTSVPLEAFQHLAKMIKLGEEAGNILPTLQTAQHYYTSALNQALTKQLRIIKFCVFCVSLSIILFVIFGVYLPLYGYLGAGYGL